MTEQEALATLVLRAEQENLFISTQTSPGFPPSPVIITHINGEGYEALLEIQAALGGFVAAVSRGPSMGIQAWRVYNDEAVEIILKLMPNLFTSSHKQARRRWAYARDTLAIWRRRSP
jgi:hypothetical protein